MSIKTLIDQYADYGLWANKRFVERLQREPDEVLDRHVPGSFPSLRATLLHIRNAEHTWWGRIAGVPTRWPAEGGDEIASVLTHSIRFIDLVHGLSEGDLAAVLSYADLKGNTHRQPIWQMIMHCLNHSTQHRGQLITQMRQLGLDDIPANDLVVYQRLAGAA